MSGYVLFTFSLPSYLTGVVLDSYIRRCRALVVLFHFALTSLWLSFGHHGNIHLFSLAPANVRAPYITGPQRFAHGPLGKLQRAQH